MAGHAKGIEDRDADVWESLLVIADIIGGEWPQRARTAAIALVKEAKEREPSLGIKLLQDLKTVYGDVASLWTKAILAKLHALEESPWGDLKGKPLDERGLARLLRQYDIKPRTVRIGEETAKGYARADLEDVWLRYLPPAPAKSVTSDTIDTSLNHQAFSVTDNSGVTDTTRHTEYVVTDAAFDVSDVVSFERLENLNKTNGVSNVTDVTLPAEACADDLDIPPYLDRRGELNQSVCDASQAHEAVQSHSHGREERERCVQCNQPGDLVECGVGGSVARLHRKCLDAWAGYLEPTN
jgi:hypothetical protein